MIAPREERSIQAHDSSRDLKDATRLSEYSLEKQQKDSPPRVERLARKLLSLKESMSVDPSGKSPEDPSSGSLVKPFQTESVT